MKQRWKTKTFNTVEKLMTYEFVNGDKVTVSASETFGLCDVSVETKTQKKTFFVTKGRSVWAFHQAENVQDYINMLEEN